MVENVIGEASIALKASFDKFRKDLSQVQTEVEKAVVPAQRKFLALGESIKDVGKKLSLRLTAPLVAAGGLALKFSTDFNAAMADVATLLPRNTDLVAGMKKEVQDLAVTTGKSTTDLARGLYQVISAGVDAKDAMSVLGVAARAATAGLTDTNTAVDAITSTLNAYGLSADKAGQVSDVLLTTVRLGKTTFGELGATIGRVIPLAAQTGVSFEDLNAAIVATTAVGLGTAEAITGIRAALNNILKPSKEASELAASLGLQFDAQTLKAKGLVPMLQEIVRATGGNTEAMTQLFGSVEGVNAVLALTSEQGMAKLTAAQQEMENALGATDLAFQTQTEGINKTGFSMAQLQQKVATIAQDLGDALAPALSKAVDAAEPLLDAVKGLVDWFANLDPELQTAIIAVAGIAVAMGPVALVVGGAMQLFAGLSAATGLLSGAFTFLLGPAGLVVAAIAAAVTIGVVLYRNWDEISAWLTSTWGSILDTALSVWNTISGFLSDTWDTIKTKVTNAFNEVKDFLSNIWDNIKQMFDDAFGDMVTSAANFGRRIMESLKKGIASIRLPVPEFSLSWHEGPLGIKIPDLDIGVNWRSLGDILHLAEGGIVLKPSLATLAERGPEAVVPLERGGGLLDEDALARAIAQHLKPSVHLETHVHSPEPLSPRETRLQNERMLRVLALEWGIR